jgi:hypothetical protein
VIPEDANADATEFQWVIDVFNDTKPPDESALTHELYHLSSFPFPATEVVVAPTLPFGKFFPCVRQLAEFLFGFLRGDYMLLIAFHH